MSNSNSTSASNSSVQNSKNSYRNLQQYNSDFEVVKCRCDIVAPLQEAWKEGTLDPGRRFFGCSNYKDVRKKCNFFLWADPSYPDRARHVIEQLKVKLRMRDAEMQKVMAELSFVERKMLVLNEECMSLRKKVEEAPVYRTKKWLCLVVFAWFVFMFMKLQCNGDCS